MKQSKVDRAVSNSERRIAEAAWALERDEMVIVTRLVLAVAGPEVKIKLKALKDQFDPEHRAKALNKLSALALRETARWYARFRVGAYFLDLRWVNSQLTRTSYVWPPFNLPDQWSPLAFQGRSVRDDIEDPSRTPMDALVEMAQALLCQSAPDEEWFP